MQISILNHVYPSNSKASDCLLISETRSIPISITLSIRAVHQLPDDKSLSCYVISLEFFSLKVLEEEH